MSDRHRPGKLSTLWENDSGQINIWEMDGTSKVGGGKVGNPGPDWHVAGTGDYNGDVTTDITFRPPTTGDVGQRMQQGWRAGGVPDRRCRRDRADPRRC